jgi:hypothetical protein
VNALGGSAQPSHLLYGLKVRCNRELASLIGLECQQEPDLEIEFVDDFHLTAFEQAECFFVNSLLDDSGQPTAVAHRSLSTGDIKIRFSDDTTIILNAAANHVWVRTPADQTTEDTSAYLLGPIMGTVLRMRGVLCLHASVVVIDGQAVAFTGPSGAGKSTTAATFAMMGYPVVTDDVLALTDEGQQFLARPAYPRVRLWPSSAQGLFGSADSLPAMTPNWDKCYLSLSGSAYRFQATPVPLKAVYFLSPRLPAQAQVARFLQVHPAQAVVELLPECYGGKYVPELSRAHEFDVLTRLVECVSLRRVSAANGFDRIHSFCEAIVNDFRYQRAPLCSRPGGRQDHGHDHP